ncbi:excisionase family DNA-binding protein [Promicromonospora soli]
MPSTTLDMKHRFASVTKAAEYADCSRDTLYRLVADGSLTRYQLGTVLRIDLVELDTILRGADA